MFMEVISENRAGTNLENTTVELEWAYKLLDYINNKIRFAELNRDSLHETVNNIHWAIRQLLRFNVDETVISDLYGKLYYVGAYLSWLIPAPSLTKTAIHEDRLTISSALMSQLLRLHANNALKNTQNYIQFDSEGRFETIAEENISKTQFRTADGVALFCGLYLQGKLDRDTLFSRLMKENPRCFVAQNNEAIVICGSPQSIVFSAPSEIANFSEHQISIGWWLEINFPPAQIGDSPYIASRIPHFVRTLLQTGQARLFLSSMGEASSFENTWYDQLIALAKYVNCRPELIVYLPQNSAFLHDYVAFINNKKAFAGVPLVIPLNSHLLLSGMQQPAQIGKSPSKKFLCFNHRPHMHRAALFLIMYRDNMFHDSYISLNDSLLKPHLAKKNSMSELSYWMGVPEEEVISLIETVEPQLPFRLDLNNEKDIANGGDPGLFFWHFDAKLHEDAAVYLVTESEMDQSMQRFTEKTVKGLAAMNPFIVFGNQGTLASLKEWGFQTFAPFIDESYDEIEDNVLRFQKAYAEVRRLNALPMNELLSQRERIYPVLEHNRRQLLNIGHLFLARLKSAIFV